MKHRFIGCIIILFFCVAGFSQVPTNGLDVQHYIFSISINDTNNVIDARTTITTKFTKDVQEVQFDLVGKNESGKGMLVLSVLKNGNSIAFEQDAQHLILHDAATKNDSAVYTILYKGIPADGLVISTNKYGQRTFFGDNWPNRAHNWLPCNDHPSDKATAEFIITAPDHYQVISNGIKTEETNLSQHLKLTHYSESIPLPMKVLVFGAADMAVNYVGTVDCIPVYSWVYPNDRDSGFAHYAVAKNILQWYTQHIAAYPYEKLANVQSKTIFNGMENASCIFYSESSVNSRDVESLMAHEIAHQWFGNSASEKDWPHLWLSEGFATYMTHAYMENKYGEDSFRNRLATDRKKIIAFTNSNNKPVVDTTESNNLKALLNANSYQKGGWILHMLRNKLGDSLFWQSVRNYYNRYKFSNANTDDLKKVFETTTHQNLDQFFQQWLYTPGLPQLKINWQYDAARKFVTVQIIQKQNTPYQFPLKLAFTSGKKTITKTISVSKATTILQLSLAWDPEKITVDPDVNLLFEEVSE